MKEITLKYKINIAVLRFILSLCFLIAANTFCFLYKKEYNKRSFFIYIVFTERYEIAGLFYRSKINVLYLYEKEYKKAVVFILLFYCGPGRIDLVLQKN